MNGRGLVDICLSESEFVVQMQNNAITDGSDEKIHKTSVPQLMHIVLQHCWLFLLWGAPTTTTKYSLYYSTVF